MGNGLAFRPYSPLATRYSPITACKIATARLPRDQSKPWNGRPKPNPRDSATSGTWPAVCITVAAISVSLVVLNEVAGAPGDPGTGGSIILWTPSSFRGVGEAHEPGIHNHEK